MDQEADWRPPAFRMLNGSFNNVCTLPPGEPPLSDSGVARCREMVASPSLSSSSVLHTPESASYSSMVAHKTAPGQRQLAGDARPHCCSADGTSMMMDILGSERGLKPASLGEDPLSSDRRMGEYLVNIV